MILHPAVPKHWLFALAGIIWTTVGLMLTVRALHLLQPFAFRIEFIMERSSVALACVIYIYGFSQSVRKKISRIHALPDRVCVFAFSGWRGYFIILLMITCGIILRSLSIPTYYLSILYTTMGCVLLIGSVVFYRQFFTIIFQKG